MENTIGEFKSVHIDLEKKIFELNGEKIPKKCISLSIWFDNGDWSLEMREELVTEYTANDQKIKE